MSKYTAIIVEGCSSQSKALSYYEAEVFFLGVQTLRNTDGSDRWGYAAAGSASSIRYLRGQALVCRRYDPRNVIGGAYREEKRM